MVYEVLSWSFAALGGIVVFMVYRYKRMNRLRDERIRQMKKKIKG